MLQRSVSSFTICIVEYRRKADIYEFPVIKLKGEEKYFPLRQFYLHDSVSNCIKYKCILILNRTELKFCFCCFVSKWNIKCFNSLKESAYEL